MKTFSNMSIVLFGLFSIMAFTSTLRIKQEVVLETPTVNPIVEMETVIEVKSVPIVVKDHTAFLNDLGHRESGNRYNIVNTYGYMGKYQFGRKTLNGLGYRGITNEEFLNTPELQEEAMQKLLEHNRKKLRKQIEKYCGEVINGVYITESGVLAAAHLAGQGNVKKFFRNGYEFKDGYGTKMTSYMSEFSDYKLNIY